MMNSFTSSFAFGGNSPSIISPVTIKNGALKSWVIAWTCGGLCSLFAQVHHNNDSVEMTNGRHNQFTFPFGYSIGDISHICQEGSWDYYIAAP